MLRCQGEAVTHQWVATNVTLCVKEGSSTANPASPRVPRDVTSHVPTGSQVSVPSPSPTDHAQVDVVCLCCL